MSHDVILRLIDEAKKASLSNFCCPHTNFSVGVSLLTKDGKIYTGFNIENHGILSICGERSAFVKALTEGCREFVAIAVVGKDLNAKLFRKTVPCGYCRQFMSEYANKDFMIYTYDDEEEKIYSYRLSDLLPNSYDF